MKQAHLPILPIETRANIYLQLSQMDQAGFSALQSFDLLEQTNKKTAKNIHLLQSKLKKGNSVAESGFKSGVFSIFDRDLLLAGEASGQLGSIYQQLADYYANKENRLRSIKSKLYLPIVIFILAIFIQPIPSLIANEISGSDYLAITAGLILKIVLCLYIIYKLSTWLTYTRLQYVGLGDIFHSLQIKLPIISKWVITRQINNFMYSLGLMLAAGMPILEAIPKANNTIKNRILRSQLQPTASLIQKGSSLTEALSQVPAINSDIIHYLLIGENSGSLAETLLHFTKNEVGKINLQEDLLAEWIPRIIYLFIIITLAFSIIGANPFGLISV